MLHDDCMHAYYIHRYAFHVSCRFSLFLFQLGLLLAETCSGDEVSEDEDAQSNSQSIFIYFLQKSIVDSQWTFDSDLLIPLAQVVSLTLGIVGGLSLGQQDVKTLIYCGWGCE